MILKLIIYKMYVTMFMHDRRLSVELNIAMRNLAIRYTSHSAVIC